MPGRHITDNQMRSFMIHKKSNTTEVAAAKAGFSRATGYRINQDPRLPSQKKAPRGRRRPDPLGGLFETDVVTLLEAHPAVRSLGLFKELLQRTPDLDPGIRRTLETVKVLSRASIRHHQALGRDGSFSDARTCQVPWRIQFDDAEHQLQAGGECAGRSCIYGVLSAQTTVGGDWRVSVLRKRCFLMVQSRFSV